jgi:hypothetical protein
VELHTLKERIIFGGSHDTDKKKKEIENNRK